MSDFFLKKPIMHWEEENLLNIECCLLDTSCG